MPLRLVFLCLVAALVPFSGCKKKGVAAPGSSGGDQVTLQLGNGAEPETLDPHLATKLIEYNILISLFEGLTMLDEATSKPRPGMAAKWDISPDALVYTFHLREAAWSNGDPVTAEDFAFSFERILTPSLASEYANMLYPIKGAEAFHQGKLSSFAEVGVRVIDARTLQLTLEQPTPYLLSLAAHQTWFPVHRGTLKKHGGLQQRDNAWTRPGNLVGNGPFVLDEWKMNQRIVVSRNSRYRGDWPGNVGRVVFHPIDDASAEERNFRTGQLHVTYRLPTERIAHYRKQSPSPLRMDAFLSTRYLRFNVTRPPLNDPRVRRALSKAIDRGALVRTALEDAMLPAGSLVPPGTAGYNSNAKVEVEIDAARRLLAEAGFEQGRGFRRLELQYSETVMDTKTVETLQEMWRRQLGIEIILQRLDHRVHISNQTAMAYDISASGWIGDYVDPTTFTDLMHSDNGNNDTGWKNAEYDALVVAAAREADETKRFAHLQRAEAIVLDEAPIAPVFYPTNLFLVQPTVKNWAPSLLGIHRYQYIRLE